MITLKLILLLNLLNLLNLLGRLNPRPMIVNFFDPWVDWIWWLNDCELISFFPPQPRSECHIFGKVTLTCSCSGSRTHRYLSSKTLSNQKTYWRSTQTFAGNKSKLCYLASHESLELVRSPHVMQHMPPQRDWHQIHQNGICSITIQ